MREIIPQTRVPAHESPAATCPYCDWPFSSKRARDLHVGEAHPDDHTDVELGAYEAAVEDEEEDLFGYHMKVFVAIGIVHAVLITLYMIAFGSGFV